LTKNSALTGFFHTLGNPPTVKLVERMKTKWWAACVAFLGACGDVQVTPKVDQPCRIPSGAKKVSVSWTANPESAVNKSGGGYRVYYCNYKDFKTAAASYVDVPYAGGASSPTTASIPGLGSGTLYVKVVAYSALNAPGSSSGSSSDPSTEVTVKVP
jgi:hypothetical protein